MTESPFVDLDAGYIHYGMYGLKCKEYLPKLSPVLLHPLWDVWVEISVHQFAYTRYLCYIHYGMYGLKS